MKKFSFLFLMAISIATVFTSCGDDTDDTKVTPPAPVLVKEYTATLLIVPQPSNLSPTFFSTRNGKTYSFTSAAIGANSDSIDFGLYFSSNFGGSLFASPNNYIRDNAWNSIFDTWKTKNLTTFKAVTGRADNNAYFQSISRNGQIDTIYTGAVTLTEKVGGTGEIGQRIGSLTRGQIIVINTSNGKKALVYVENLTPGQGPDGNITIKVKSQG